MNAIEIKDLCKDYGEFRLDHLNLNLPSGCILGLIGENGAGKSTTIKLILDIIKKDDGKVKILGNEDITLAKQDIGVVMDGVGLAHNLNSIDMGKVMQLTYHNWDEEKYYNLLKQFKLNNYKPFSKYSRGMKMKLGIAIALAHDSKLLILDEATSGLDPLVRDEVIDLLLDFTRDENHSVLISSHIVSDLEKLCDYIAFLHEGKLALYAPKDELLAKYGMIHVTKEQLADIDNEAILYQKVNPYGVDVICLRDKVSRDIPVGVISIEDLFIFMIKGGKL